MTGEAKRRIRTMKDEPARANLISSKSCESNSNDATSSLASFHSIDSEPPVKSKLSHSSQVGKGSTLSKPISSQLTQSALTAIENNTLDSVSYSVSFVFAKTKETL